MQAHASHGGANASRLHRIAALLCDAKSEWQELLSHDGMASNAMVQVVQAPALAMQLFLHILRNMNAGIGVAECGFGHDFCRTQARSEGHLPDKSCPWSQGVRGS